MADVTTGERPALFSFLHLGAAWPFIWPALVGFVAFIAFLCAVAAVDMWSKGAWGE